MVPSQLKILIPVGTPTAIVVIVKKLFVYELIPTENMWCAQTLMLTNPMQTVAATMTGYPKIGFREKTGMISDMKAKQGIIRTYTSGWPNIQKKCIHSTAEPPACASKKWPPRYRSMGSMIWAAERGAMTIRNIQATTQLSHASKGMRLSFIPGQRMHRMVAIMLIAVP